VAADLLQAARAKADPRHVRVVEHIAPDARVVDADTTALPQVVSNLVDNAVRHTAGGEVVLFTHRENGAVVVGVRDTGSGIPSEHLQRIFERFYRVDAARSRDEGGTGLGLAIVRHMVEAHGGRVWAESEVGVGTTISARFPDA
jgi:signal transduction histidine kinase